MLSAHSKVRKGCDEADAMLHLIFEIDGKICYLDGFHKVQVPFLRLCFELFLNKNKLLFLMDGRPSASEEFGIQLLTSLSFFSLQRLFLE